MVPVAVTGKYFISGVIIEGTGTGAAVISAVISAKKVQLSPDEARDLARRAVKFKQERGRLPSITSADAWEKKMAEGVAFLARMKQEAANGERIYPGRLRAAR